MNKIKKIAFPHPPGMGGPGSFQMQFEKTLKEKGWQIYYPEDNIVPDLIFILGGTRQIMWLWKLMRKKVPIFFRLGGINWLYKNKPISLRNKIIIYSNLKLLILAQYLFADGIIYQSKFAKSWLLKFNQSARIKNNIIIYNGVDTNTFKPRSKQKNNETSILCVEGTIDYTPYAIDLLNTLQKELIEKSNFKSLIVYGKFESKKSKQLLSKDIDFRGTVSRQEIPNVYKDAVFLSLDINATCPNTVIEAMASGIPIIGFDTGSLKELVKDKAGIVTKYGSDPWLLDTPDVDSLIEDAKIVLDNYTIYSKQARKIATKYFSFDEVVKKYLRFIIN